MPAMVVRYHTVLRLVAAVLALVVPSCVTSPPPAAARGGDLSPMARMWASPLDLGRVGGTLRQPGILCRLRGGTSLPARQGSLIEKERPAESEVAAARSV